MKHKMLHRTPSSLGPLLKDQRELQPFLLMKGAGRGLSVREVARRAGISPGQLSRIETGKTKHPSEDTVWGLAAALGGDGEPLQVLAGNTGEGDGVEYLIELVRHFEALKDEMATLSDEINDLIGDEDQIRKDPKRAAGVLFMATRQLSRSIFDWSPGRPNPQQSELGEIAGIWSALTPERRALIRTFVADQEVLSTLDRLPNPRGRYRFTIELEERDREDEDG
jgi:transcriptional regulator with XRE-family HTH domain